MSNHSLLACLIGVSVMCEAAPIIIGSSFTGNFNQVSWGNSPLYQINTQTGAATASGGVSFPYELTTAQQPGTVIGWSPVNPYISNVFTTQSPPCCQAIVNNMRGAVGGTYDSETQLLYSISSFSPPAPTLYSSLFISCPGNSFTCPMEGPATLVGPVGLPNSTLLDYAPATGLLGLSGNALYSINTTTGVATLIAVLYLPPSANLLTPIPQDFAYDDATGRLIVAAANHTPWQLIAGAQHGLYSVDLKTGWGTLLTDQGPEIIGLARVETPEAPMWTLFAIGLGLLGLARSRS